MTRTSIGRPYPFGATVTADGINFALFSRHATRVYLELFKAPDDSSAWRSVALDPARNRTGDVWHIFAHGLEGGQLYGFRVDGPYQPERGHRFNVHKLLMDPYARGLAGEYRLGNDALYGYDRSSPLGDLSYSSVDSAPFTAKAVAMAPSLFDWKDVRPPGRPLADEIIYEAHVKGFTAHPTAAVAEGGTYRGLIEKIPHLVELGITAVELLPVHEFNEGEPIGLDPVTGSPLHNYWGYSTIGFFSPEQSYAHTRQPGGHVLEFQQMVSELHRAGISVILDVVFNHTGEGNERGPTLSMRGLDNATYYMLDGGRRYRNYSGCGNTVNCNHPMLKQFILDCLRYWVVEMHVDGFRFDLATILGRASSGEWIGDLSLLYDIGGDPVLRGCTLIAEAWDADGMYKVGGFPSTWAEWNGRFRDDLRRFVRGDRGMAAEMARRIGGSRDLFARKESPAQSINFVTCHDGFTLRDLVSYREKHNERNAEENRDGANENFSANWGAEGETVDPAIRRLRLQLAKNLLTALFVSRGTPMLLGGDERWRTQHGNNNTYCQDNELGWIDWSPSLEAAEIHRFVRLLCTLRRRHPALRRTTFVDPFAVDGGEVGQIGTDISWHGVKLERPDWAYHSHTVACQIHGGADDADFYLVLSAYAEPLRFELPPLPTNRRWLRLIDTSLPSPEEILSEDRARPVRGSHYAVPPRTAVLLFAPR